MSRAPAPATCGLAIDVPEMKPWIVGGVGVVPTAARMSTPGAVTGGTIVSIARFGPRDEKLAMMSPNCVVDDELGAGDRGDVAGAGGEPRLERRAVVEA